jgi:hypothetical protein
LPLLGKWNVLHTCCPLSNTCKAPGRGKRPKTTKNFRFPSNSFVATVHDHVVFPASDKSAITTDTTHNSAAGALSQKCPKFTTNHLGSPERFSLSFNLNQATQLGLTRIRICSGREPGHNGHLCRDTNFVFARPKSRCQTFSQPGSLRPRTRALRGWSTHFRWGS